MGSPISMMPNNPDIFSCGYKENGWSAAIAMKKPRKVVVFGFPFECITGAENRAKVMQAVTEYLKE